MPRDVAQRGGCANSKSKLPRSQAQQPTAGVQGPQKRAPTHQPRQAQPKGHPSRRAGPLRAGWGPFGQSSPCGPALRLRARPLLRASGRLRCSSGLLGGHLGVALAAGRRLAPCGLSVPCGLCPFPRPLPRLVSFFLRFVVRLRGRIVASIPPCQLPCVGSAPRGLCPLCPVVPWAGPRVGCPAIRRGPGFNSRPWRFLEAHCSFASF